jgi:hypothetical protein
MVIPVYSCPNQEHPWENHVMGMKPSVAQSIYDPAVDSPCMISMGKEKGLNQSTYSIAWVMVSFSLHNMII